MGHQHAGAGAKYGGRLAIVFNQTALYTLSAHARVAPNADGDAVLDQMCERLADRFDIHHSTIQVERSRREEDIYHETEGET
jgi:hypothetical protein